MQQNYNKKNKNLAQLGQGKWKSAFGHALLIVGFVLGFGGMNAWGQAQGELMMSKTWTATPGTNGHKGVITLETFVTGSEITTTTHQPNDIVLVLDFSSSMRDHMGTLKDAVSTFCNMILQDAVSNSVDHRISICSFATGPNQINSYGHSYAAYNGTELRTGTLSNTYPNYTDAEYTSSLVSIKDGNTINSEVQTAINQITRSNVSSGTYMQYGLDMALKVLNKRTQKTFISEGKEYPRGMIVVFFTDGHPGYGWGTQNYWRNNHSSGIVEEADAAVANAAEIKAIRVDKHDAENDEKPRVYSIGILDNADNSSAYKCSKEVHSTYDRWQGLGTNGPSSGSYACINGLLHFISSDFDENTTSWQPTIENNGASAVSGYEGYYFGSSQMSELQTAFANIASQSGATPINMTSATIIQDIVSESFKLPAGTTVNDIKIYAPKLERIENETNPTKDDYKFESLQEGVLTLGKDAAGNIGVVIGGSENRLPTSYTYRNDQNQNVTVNVVSISGADNKKLQITGFNFKENWCGKLNNTIRGRKIVIIIPVEVEEGVWGDGIMTNGQMSVIYPNGEQEPIYFEQPTADVLGDVWTEVITEKPDGFDEDNIDSPEDLAWFISLVNGRYNYDINNKIPSNPTLSGTLTADIDMSAHNWVPIGSDYKVKLNDSGETELVLDDEGNPIRVGYEGIFNGNGHVITGLKNNASRMYKKASGQGGQVVVFPGMFGNVKGDGATSGVVKNVFVLDADFRAKHHDNGFIHFGIIADTLTGGAIYNCEAVGRLTCENTVNTVTNGNQTTSYYPQDLVIGGLVGLNDGGTIHSSMAMATLTGYCMGGMVGEMYNSTLSNSFTNGVYNYLGTSATNPSGNDPQALFRYVGGLVGRNHHVKIGEPSSIKAGTINNCYVRFERNNSLGDASTGALFGQLVGSNKRQGSSLSAEGTITNCYVPGNDATPPTIVFVADDATKTFPLYSNAYDQTKITSSRGNDNMVGGTWANGIIVGGTPLVMKLNQNVESGQATWKRTTAGGYENGYFDTDHVYVKLPDGGNINSDYPILQFNDFKCVASTEGITLDYAANLDEMLDRHNTGNLNVNTSIINDYTGYPEIEPGVSNEDYNPDYYKKFAHSAIYGGTINLYANDNTTKSTMSVTNQQDNTTISTMVYIDENVSLLQSEDSNIDAYTCQTMKSLSDPCTYDPETNTWDETNLYSPAGQRWHVVSSSLSNSEFGWSYGDNGDGSYEDVQVQHNTNENPCHFWLDENDNDYSLFPADASARPVDFYCFFEPEYHWINFKRNGKSHWHMDLIDDAGDYDNPANHARIVYYYNKKNDNGNGFTQVLDNETSFIPGKGYLLAIYPQYYANYHAWDITTANGNTEQMMNQLIEEKKLQLLQNRGVLNNGPVSIPVTYTTENEWTGLAGYNLLGNPYQSYLDFATFASVNSALWNNDANAMTYAVYDPTLNIYAQATAAGQASQGSYAAKGDINMHQGFFICVKNKNGGTATFNNSMRSNTPAAGTQFRGERPNYPVINLIVTDSEGNNDVAVLEVGRPENGGGEKLRVGSATGRISLRHDDTDFGILFSDMTEGSQPLRFETEEDGTFTLSWNTANANFSSLTLVDNITGVHYDMLAHDSYEFEGRASDYKSRFKILIGEFTDVEENEETVTNNFAFFDGSEWVVNGKGQLMVADVMGRTVYIGNLTNDQNRVSLNGLSQGVYLMQVRNGNGAMVQKIVVK